MDYNEIRKLLYRHKDEVEARVSSGIELYRKGNINLKITDKDGKEVTGAKVSFKQKTHEFQFGANCFLLDELSDNEKNEKYKEYFKELFNTATVPFYWRDLEPEQGKPRYAKDSVKVYRRPAPDLCLEWCEKNGITPKAHCVVYEGWQPLWLPNDVTEIKKLYEKRFVELSERYKDRIKSWEVINETLCRCPSLFANQPDYVSWSLKMSEKYFPNNELIINEYSRVIDLPVNAVRNPYYLLIKDCLNEGLRIDTVGLQYHMFYQKEEYAQKAEQNYDLLYLYALYDRLSEFNKPLQVTEVTIPCYSSEKEAEELQADIVEMLYKVWFSQRNMESVFYWNLVDGYAAFGGEGTNDGENYFRGGLVRHDFTKKPAYYRIYDLIHKQWQSEGKTETVNGKATFRGFYGKYKVTVEANGKVVEKELSLSKNAINTYSLEV